MILTKSERRKQLPLRFKLLCPLCFLLPWVIAHFLYLDSPFSSNIFTNFLLLALLHLPILLCGALEVSSVKWLRKNGLLD